MSMMTPPEKAFALIMVRNPHLNYEQVMTLARLAVGADK